MSRYVARRRVERDLVSKDVFVPQVHAPGAEAEVDFGEFETTLAGVGVKLWMFVALGQGVPRRVQIGRAHV